MSDNIKICPRCSAEYFAHAETCATCEIPLVYPGESAEEHTGHSDDMINWPEGPNEVLMEAPLNILVDMGSALNAKHKPYEIVEMTSDNAEVLEASKTSSCSTEPNYAIIVPAQYLEESIKITQDHWYEKHPDQRDTDEKIEKGLCPACGTAVLGSTLECPDCGLNLAGSASSGHGDCC